MPKKKSDIGPILAEGPFGAQLHDQLLYFYIVRIFGLRPKLYWNLKWLTQPDRRRNELVKGESKLTFYINTSWHFMHYAKMLTFNYPWYNSSQKEICKNITCMKKKLSRYIKLRMCILFVCYYWSVRSHAKIGLLIEVTITCILA